MESVCVAAAGSKPQRRSIQHTTALLCVPSPRAERGGVSCHHLRAVCAKDMLTHVYLVW